MYYLIVLGPWNVTVHLFSVDGRFCITKRSTMRESLFERCIFYVCIFYAAQCLWSCCVAILGGRSVCEGGSELCDIQL